MQTVIKIVTDKVEKGTNAVSTDTLGVGLVTFSETIQKSLGITR